MSAWSIALLVLGFFALIFGTLLLLTYLIKKSGDREPMQKFANWFVEKFL